MKHSSLTRLAAWLLVLILTAATLPLIFTCASTSAASNIVITLDPGHGPGGAGADPRDPHAQGKGKPHG